MIYLTANKGVFDGIDIASLAEGFIDIILYGLIGFAIAMVVMYYCKIIAGKGVRLLMENEAFSPETAKSLSELGIDKNVKYHESRLEKSVPQSHICVTVDGEPKRYYIPEQKLSRAQRTYTVNEKPLGMTVISIIIIAIVFGLIFFTKDLIVEKVSALANSITVSESGGHKTEDGFEYFPDKEEQKLPTGEEENEKITEDEASDTEEQNEQS